MYGSDFCACASSYAICCYCKIDGKHKVTQLARLFSPHTPGVIRIVNRSATRKRSFPRMRGAILYGG